MSKQKVFISHGSVDKDYLRTLKVMLDQKTGGTLDLFLSSDGQSIPFGANWVSTIEKALANASVMFVAISPRSADSSWIYFEAGNAYSRGIKVIPIGIMGLKIEKLPPPLSLLQGFNITSHEGLNNMIEVINTEYKYKFAQDFVREDFERLRALELSSTSEATRLADNVDFITVDLPSKVVSCEREHELLKEASTLARATLSRMGLTFYSVSEWDLLLSGIKIWFRRQQGEVKGVHIAVDPLSVDFGIPVIRELTQDLYAGPTLDRFWFKVYFPKEFRIITDDFKISSRVASVGIYICEEQADLFGFENILFALDSPNPDEYYSPEVIAFNEPRPCLRVVAGTDSSSQLPLLNLVDALITAGVIQPSHKEHP